jgi:glutamyl-tRNA reductase
VDIVIASAACPKAFITSEEAARWSKARRGRALFMIDLGVPRNVEEEVNELSDVYLYNIDDLQGMANDNFKGREEAAKLGGHIVEQSAERFMVNLNEEEHRATERSQT